MTSRIDINTENKGNVRSCFYASTTPVSIKKYRVKYSSINNINTVSRGELNAVFSQLRRLT